MATQNKKRHTVFIRYVFFVVKKSDHCSMSILLWSPTLPILMDGLSKKSAYLDTAVPVWCPIPRNSLAIRYRIVQVSSQCEMVLLFFHFHTVDTVVVYLPTAAANAYYFYTRPKCVPAPKKRTRDAFFMIYESDSASFFTTQTCIIP